MGLDLNYPGVYQYWGPLWALITLLVFVQIPTALTLFSQDTSYSALLTLPFRMLASRWGRDVMTLTHVGSGALILLLGLACIALWFQQKLNSGIPLSQLLLDRGWTVLAWPIIALTIATIALAVSGVSLYANVRPGTRLPVWRFDYVLSKKIHRLSFIIMLAVLVYHLFLTPRVSGMWLSWLSDPGLFGLIVLLVLVVLGVAVIHGAFMGLEWVTHSMFRKTLARSVAPASLVGVIGLTGLAVAASVEPVPVGWVGAVGLGVVLLMLALTMAFAFAYRQK
ncbi:MAG: DUF4405 domain-containing protein [Dehalococcoidia bacterium]|jgi:hypothetical protein|nr:DUF4405 domain-containing protein [Dehalococcoidia bacterium]MDP6227781.1 DUF4405 domain-containing protein [Dehalococcoidia bacterium]MDP7085368.1 DUF4405 domain-containing protein [Dehalococcoidia bacterium]MDP7202160.1 DUF4405 domain-containing protein [Dehalococcoidia bacterium]HJN88411.1 DUF4405 domain-containing protein [Dehalococcoidia bacterium]